MKGGRYAHIFLMLASTLMVLAAAETILHVHFRLSNNYWLFVGNKNFQIGFTQPVADERAYALRSGFRGWGIAIDSIGIRGRRPPKSSAKRVIANMGDSVPFGIKLGNNETYSFFLDSIIKAREKQFEVVNGGIPGYNMRQTFYNLKNLVYPEFHPRIVTMQAANDLFLLSFYRDKWTPKVTWAKRWSRTWGETTKSSLVYYVRSVFAKKPEPEVYLKYNGKAMLDFIREELVPEIIAFCRENNITLIFMPVDPFYYSDKESPKNPILDLWKENIKDVDIWDETVKSYNAILAGHAEKHDHVYFFDVRTRLDNHDRNGLFVDYIHYSPQGNRLVAAGLMDFLVENGMVD